MNQLVEFMEKHYPPMGLSYKLALVEEVMEETGWTRDEIFRMAREEMAVGELVTHYCSDGTRWGDNEALPEARAASKIQMADIVVDNWVDENSPRLFIECAKGAT